MLKTCVSVVLGVFFTTIGSVKVGAGELLPDVYAMQQDAVGTRYAQYCGLRRAGRFGFCATGS